MNISRRAFRAVIIRPTRARIPNKSQRWPGKGSACPTPSGIKRDDQLAHALTQDGTLIPLLVNILILQPFCILIQVYSRYTPSGAVTAIPRKGHRFVTVTTYFCTTRGPRPSHYSERLLRSLVCVENNGKRNQIPEKKKKKYGKCSETTIISTTNECTYIHRRALNTIVRPYKQ